MMIRKKILSLVYFASSLSMGLNATVLTVNSNLDSAPTTGGVGAGTTGDLRYVLNFANQIADTYQVVFTLGAGNETVTLQDMLPILNLNAANNLTIDGNNTLGSGLNVSINGANANRGFFAQQGPILIQNLTIQNTLARGGNGGVGSGGGGLGAGSGLFINQAQVTLDTVNFVNNVSTGGNGAGASGLNTGAGGGMGGDGGSLGLAGGGGLGGDGGGDPTGTMPGGGGGISPGGAGGTGGAAGQAGGAIGSAAAGNSTNGTLGGITGGGGGSGTIAADRGGGGGVAGADGTVVGGNGGFGGGGGGVAGNGGFGGGGAVQGAGGFGGGAGINSTTGGGFGGGGGGSSGFTAGVSGGPGVVGGGGGGGGLGGAIFVNKSTAYGGGGASLTVIGPVTTSGSTVNAGTGGGGAPSGANVGSSIFATTGSPLVFNPGAAETVLIAGTIADDSANSLPGPGYRPGTAAGVGILKQGAGTLTLLGNNTYAGGTVLNAGILQINSDNSLGATNTSLQVTGNAILQALATIASARTISTTNTFTVDTNGNNVTLSGIVSGLGSLVKTGLGTLSLLGVNTYAGGTTLNAGVLLVNSDFSFGQTGTGITVTGNSTLETATTFASSRAINLNSNQLIFNTTANTLTWSGVISGLGGITKTGAGTLALLGVNTYAGGTTLNQGILSVNSDASFGQAGTGLNVTGNSTLQAAASYLSSARDINLNANRLTVDTNGNDIGWDGTISGSGGIDKIGTGNLIIKGGNPYTGQTNILVGELIIVNTATNTTPSLFNIAAGAQFGIEQASSTIGTYSGGLSGSGIFTVNQNGGSGKVILTGPMTFTGDTTVYSGILQGTSATLPQTITNQSLVDIEQTAGTATYTGVISGPGGVIFNSEPGNAGTIVLAGNNTYSGGSFINAGTVRGTTTTLQGDIIINTGAFADFEQVAGTGVSSSNISGGGALLINTQPGSVGTVELTGANSYTGGTLISNGRLKGNTTSLQGLIIDNSELEFNQTTAGTFNGTISGPGLIEKTGVGLLRFVFNNNFFTGITNVRGGILSLEAIQGGDVSVFSNAALAGNGTVLGDVTINSGGTIAPGIGSFNIGGNFLQESGSFYIASLNLAGQSSLIDALGTVGIQNDTTLILNPTDGVRVNTLYTVAEGDAGVFGQYTNVFLDKQFLFGNTLYDENNVYVFVTVDFNLIADTFNQQQVANQFAPFTFNLPPGLQEVLQEFSTLGQFEARRALDQMSGVQYTNVISTALLANRKFNRRIFDPLRTIITANPCAPEVYCTYKPSFDLWSSMGGGYTFVQGSRSLEGYRISDFEINFGAQARFTRSLTVGSALAYERDSLTYKIGGSGRNDSLLGAFYTLYRPKRFYVYGNLNFGNNIGKIRRNIDIGTLNYRPRSNLKVYQKSIYAEIGMDFGLKFALLQPFFALESGTVRFSRIREQGGFPLNLNIRSKSYNNSAMRLGIHVSTAPLLTSWVMGMDLSWNYNFSQSKNSILVNFQDFGNEFKIKGLPLHRNSFEIDLMVNKNINKWWSFYVEANALGWQNSFSYNIAGGLQASW